MAMCPLYPGIALSENAVCGQYQEKMNALLLAFLISPAYAETDCYTGRYTGFRYRHPYDAISTRVPVYNSKGITRPGFRTFRNNCLIA